MWLNISSTSHLHGDLFTLFWGYRAKGSRRAILWNWKNHPRYERTDLKPTGLKGVKRELEARNSTGRQFLLFIYFFYFLVSGTKVLTQAFCSLANDYKWQMIYHLPSTTEPWHKPFFPGARLRPQSSYLCPPPSWDCRCETPYLVCWLTWNLTNFWPRLASNHEPSYLCLSSE
jgi:hypothetical protein